MLSAAVSEQLRTQLLDVKPFMDAILRLVGTPFQRARK
jgi:hypothetical protein